MYLLKTALIFFVTISVVTEFIYTKRENNYLRGGPACYYPLVEILPIGTKMQVVEKIKKWINVRVSNGKSGWISENSISIPKPHVTYEERLLKTWSSAKASKTGIAAAIKGLTKKIGITDTGDVDLLLKLTENVFSPDELNKFRNELEKVRSKNVNRVNLDDLDLKTPEYDPSIRELQVGVGVASRLLSKGAVLNKELSKYVNLICQVLITHSYFYDWDFKVIIIDDEKIDGFACPGGYVFVTKGAILNCKDEAELASIIAHEIAHVVRKHGLQEMTERKVQIKADQAIAELEAELEAEKDSIEIELEHIILNGYEKIVHERLLNYEIESDLIASILCANAGYDPVGIVRVAKSLAELYKEEKDIFSYDYASPNDANIRFSAIQKFVGKNFLKEKLNGQLSIRLNHYKQMLRSY